MDLKISLIVPTYNESENIVEFLNTAHEALGPIPHEVVVVDDDSPDKTWEKAGVFALAHPWVRVIRRTQDRGLSAAVIAGFDSSQSPLLAVMDADLSHDARILPKLIQAIDQGADMAVGSRRVPGGGATQWPWYRRLTSSMATLMAKVLLGISINDPMSGYFVLTRPLYNSCRKRLNPRGYKILLEIYAKSNPRRVEEIPYVFTDRKQGYSKMSASVIRQYVEMLILLALQRFKHRSERP